MTDEPVYIFAPLAEVGCLRTIMSKTGIPCRINDYQVQHWSGLHHVYYFKYAQLDSVQRLILESAQAAGARVEALLIYFERHLGQIEIDLLGPENLLQMDVDFSTGTRVQQILRRGADITCALLGLVGFFVPGLLVALWIKLDSNGPVFFYQLRTGLYNREFEIIKFRSMHADAERHGARWAGQNDTRVTRVGYWLRKLRIDEVPQLWNVLRGDMSIIGPRPEREVFIHQLELDIPYYRFRHLIKPGITGLAQVMFTYGASLEDARQKHRYDLYYIKHRGWKLDLKILKDTFLTVLRGAGI